MRKPLLILLALTLASLVTLSLIHQLTRTPTVGEQVHAAIDKTVGPLPAGPVLLDYVPGQPANTFTLQVGPDSLAIDRHVRWIELTGDVRPPESTPDDGGGPIRLVVPGRTLALSPQVRSVQLPAGPGRWSLALAGPGYTLERTRGSGEVHALFSGPDADTAVAQLSVALLPLMKKTESSEEWVTTWRTTLLTHNEFDLFQDWLAADPARLDRAPDLATACRRAFPLLLPRGSIVLRWPDDTAFAITGSRPTSNGESRIQMFGFEKDPAGNRVLAWSATAFFKTGIPPEEVRRIISGLVADTDKVTR